MRKDNEEFAGTLGAIGPRLAELRRQAGLSQADLAARMDMSQPARGGARAYISQVEHGHRTGLSVAALAAMLRGCRADFHDIIDILDGFTRRPTVSQVRAATAIEELESRLRGQVRITGEVKSQKAKGKSQNGGKEPLTNTDDHGRTRAGR